MRIAIAGAGIGGLTAALVSAQHGHDVVLCERLAELGELGAGIQISPNARRVLASIGVDDAFDRVATHPTRIVLRRWDDDRELRVTLLDDAYGRRYGHRYANVSRADLVRVLADATAADPRIDLRVGVSVAGVQHTTTGVALVLDDGTAIDADVVVGADGIHSRVRSSMLGATASRFSGAVAFRALVPRDDVPPGSAAVEVTNRLGPDRHVVTYWVGRDRSHLNVVAVAPEPSWQVESWTERATKEALVAAFAGWSPALVTLLGRVEEPLYRWALHDREPLPDWGVGRATLLGDACHPMLPFMAQGACQAIEDAAVLARCLDAIEGSNPLAIGAALRRYEEVRRPRTARVQGLSWRNRTTFHLPDGDEQQRRDAALAKPADDAAMDWLYGFDPLIAPIDASAG